MQTKNKILLIIAIMAFLIFAVATILIYTSDEYVRARDQLVYLNSDWGRLSVETEEHLNNISGRNDDSANREWKQKVENTEELISSKQTLCLICGGLSILSLGGVVVISIQSKKQKKNDNTTNTITS